MNVQLVSQSIVITVEIGDTLIEVVVLRKLDFEYSMLLERRRKRGG